MTITRFLLLPLALALAACSTDQVALTLDGVAVAVAAANASLPGLQSSGAIDAEAAQVASSYFGAVTAAALHSSDVLLDHSLTPRQQRAAIVTAFADAIAPRFAAGTVPDKVARTISAVSRSVALFLAATETLHQEAQAAGCGDVPVERIAKIDAKKVRKARERLQKLRQRR